MGAGSGKMRVYPVGKKYPPFLIFCLFIYLFVVVANWLSVAASSAWMPPPLRKIKGGQGVGGGRSLGGGGSGGGCTCRQTGRTEPV